MASKVQSHWPPNVPGHADGVGRARIECRTAQSGFMLWLLCQLTSESNEHGDVAWILTAQKRPALSDSNSVFGVLEWFLHLSIRVSRHTASL